MKNRFFIYILLLAVTACSDEPLFLDNSNNNAALQDQGIYVLCEGLFNQNNSTLAYFDKNSTEKDIYYSVNRRKLGDTANDILYYDNKIYIAVSVSDYVEVIDAGNCKSIKMIPFGSENHSAQPRSIAAYQDKIYVCCYDGTVCRIDTATLSIEKSIKVGRNPDDIAIANQKIYVSNSGGLDFENPDNTISVIDINSFTEIKKIEVHPNPGCMATDSDNRLFVVSRGIYNQQTNSYDTRLHIIDTETDAVSNTLNVDVTNIASDGSNIYLYGESKNKVTVMESATCQIYNNSFIMDGTQIERIYGIDINPRNGDVYICDAIDYVTPGSIFCFDKFGYLKFSFSNVGINPNEVVFANADDLNSSIQQQPLFRTPTAVLAYKPAPGQFVNEMPLYKEGDNDSIMRAKCLEKLSNTNSGYVSLGGFGGSITVSFVPAIENKADDYDFQILGNAFTGSAEPGVIRVSADTNNNGIADDDWFEIAGSEHISGNITPNYTVTYLRPETPTSPIKWSDNNGANGIMDRLDSFHPQPYYPQWIEENSITVSGTLIHHNLEYVYGQWKSYPKDWGYADNQSNNNEKSKIKIEWATDNNGNPVVLEKIDFIEIITAVHLQEDLIGELSTEISSIIVL